ncbi:hypothetical protein F4780DRAFT_783408 [Xylariomycetidae sp. FL0641]|nr:hypothetical protein F4780DRAFT_783408 [Xylariomycetidae sp. FL0641]
MSWSLTKPTKVARVPCCKAFISQHNSAPRFFHNNPADKNPDNKDKRHPTPPLGSFARTNDSITVEYPEEDQLPSSTPVQGRAHLEGAPWGLLAHPSPST